MRKLLVGSWLAIGAVPFLFLGGIEGLKSLGSSGVSELERQPAQRIAETLNRRMLFRISIGEKLKIIEQDAYFSKDTIYLSFKVDHRGALIPDDAPYEFVQRVQSRLHDSAAKLLCPYLVAAQGARRIRVSVVTKDLEDSVTVPLYRGECPDGSA